MKEFILFYFNTHPEKVRGVVHSHIDLWNNQQFESYDRRPNIRISYKRVAAIDKNRGITL